MIVTAVVIIAVLLYMYGYHDHCVCLDDPRTCCDPNQVNTLYTNMKIPREVTSVFHFISSSLSETVSNLSLIHI